MKAIICVLVLLISACSTVIKIPTVSSGSKADGTVTVFWEKKRNEKVEVNWAEADINAALACQKWGYGGAERFATYNYTCRNRGCTHVTYTYEYQCLD